MNATTPAQQQIVGAQAVARAWQTGSSTVIATVGNQTITDADLRQAEAATKDNLAYMTSQIDANAPATAFLQAYVRLMDKAGVANVALGSVIVHAALYQDAVAKGYQPTDQEVAAKVARDKAHADQGKDPVLAAYAAVIGPTYWTTTYTQVVRQDLATSNLRAATVKGMTGFADQKKAWDTLSWQVIQHTPVTVQQPGAIVPATVSAALQYLSAYYAAGFGG